MRMLHLQIARRTFRPITPSFRPAEFQEPQTRNLNVAQSAIDASNIVTMPVLPPEIFRELLPWLFVMCKRRSQATASIVSFMRTSRASYGVGLPQLWRDIELDAPDTADYRQLRRNKVVTVQKILDFGRQAGTLRLVRVLRLRYWSRWEPLLEELLVEIASSLRHLEAVGSPSWHIERYPKAASYQIAQS